MSRCEGGDEILNHDENPPPQETRPSGKDEDATKLVHRGRRVKLQPISSETTSSAEVSSSPNTRQIDRDDKAVDGDLPGRVHGDSDGGEGFQTPGVDASGDVVNRVGVTRALGSHHDGNASGLESDGENVEPSTLSENAKQEDVEFMGYEIPDKLSFYEAMKPMIWSMKLFGIWHCESIEPGLLRKNTTGPKRWYKKFSGMRAYCLFVIFVLWMNFLRYIPAFWFGQVESMRKELLFFKVTYIAFTLQCAANASLMFFGTETRNRLPRFFHHWEDRIQSSAESMVDLTYVRRRSVIFAVCGALFIALHFVYRVFGVFGPVESIKNSTAVFAAPFPDSTGVQLCVLIIDVFECASWVYPICFYVLVCLVIRTQFERFDRRLDHAVVRACEKGGGLPDNFEELRYQHQELCVAVRNSNQGLLTYTNAVAYATMLPLVCFLLYQLIISGTDRSNISAQLMYVIWLVSIFVNVAVVSWIAAIVNSRAHAPLNKTFNIIVKDATDEELLVMKMFTSRLNGTAVGYTIFDLVTLTKPFILTMAGLGVTYFALLAEFD